MQTRTVKECAEILRVSPATVYQLCARRKLPHVRVGAGRGTIRIREEDLAAYLAAAAVPSVAAATSAPVMLKHLKVR